MNNLIDLVDKVKYAIEDAVCSVKCNILNAVDYVKYDVLKREYPMPAFFVDEEAPKKKKKSKKKKKK